MREYSILKAKNAVTLAKVNVQTDTKDTGEKDAEGKPIESTVIEPKIMLLKKNFNANTGEVDNIHASSVSVVELDARIAFLQAEIDELNKMKTDISAAEGKAAIEAHTPEAAFPAEVEKP